MAPLEAAIRSGLGRNASDDELLRASQGYWTQTAAPDVRTNAHWRDGAAFFDDRIWKRLGGFHRKLLEDAVAAADSTSTRSLLEWGCGGGMNAAALADRFERYLGVDLAPATLAECERQYTAVGGRGFVGVPIDAARPESALARLDEPVDAYLCTYVMELAPTREYGRRIVQIAYDALRPGGVALIQIRYARFPWQRWRRDDYVLHLAHNTTYGVAEFRSLARDVGFDVLFEKFVPRQPELKERRYAYFALRKP